MPVIHRSSTAFTTVRAPYGSVDGMRLLIPPLVNGFHDGHFAQPMAADCSFFHLSTAFTVCGPFCTANGSGFLLLAVVNIFHHGLHAVLLRGWQLIAYSSARQWHSRFARRFAHRMVADCSSFCLSTAFATVCMLISSADGSALLVLPLVNGFHGLRAVLLNGWQRIARTCARQWLSLFARCLLGE